MRLRSLLAASMAVATLAGCAFFEDLKPAVGFTIEATPEGRPSFRLNLTTTRSIEPADAKVEEPAASAAQASLTTE